MFASQHLAPTERKGNESIGSYKHIAPTGRVMFMSHLMPWSNQHAPNQ